MLRKEWLNGVGTLTPSARARNVIRKAIELGIFPLWQYSRYQIAMLRGHGNTDVLKATNKIDLDLASALLDREEQVDPNRQTLFNYVLA